MRKIRREVTRKVVEAAVMSGRPVQLRKDKPSEANSKPRMTRIGGNLETEGNEDSEAPAQSVHIEITFVSFVIFCWRKKRLGTARHSGFTETTLVVPDDPSYPVDP
jgi:hypothetical protein